VGIYTQIVPAGMTLGVRLTLIIALMQVNAAFLILTLPVLGLMTTDGEHVRIFKILPGAFLG
jgi:hypothetical protein